MDTIIVTGCPRSGTSMEMLSLGRAFGMDKVNGLEFPQITRFEKGEKLKDETDEQYDMHKYVWEKFANTDERKEKLKKSINMNPNGFWEGRYLHGVKMHKDFELTDGSIVKVIGFGIPKCDPTLVGKIIYMLRHPRAVAKSQESLQRKMEMPVRDGVEVTEHSALTYCKETATVAKWLLKHPEIPVLIQEYEKLVENPDAQFKIQQEFLGGGDFSNHPVTPKLNRSKWGTEESHIWKHAEAIHAFMKVKDFQSVVDYYTANKTEIVKDRTNTPCVRLGREVANAVCENSCNKCEINFIKNAIRTAQSKGINWKTEPCMYRAMKKKTESMQQTIDNNHWVETINSITPASKIEMRLPQFIRVAIHKIRGK